MALPVWTPAYVGIGSNLLDPNAQVLRGFDALAALPETLLIARSRLYRTAPVGPQQQPHFINAVAGLLTQLSGPLLLAKLKKLEAKLGRTQPVERWGPRIIDFDLLALGAQRIDSETLTVPHREIAHRAFALLPLAELAPNLELPGVGRVATLLASVDSSGVCAL
jgi:2-amino-4-hydroxy-6-hydroxymethyldihydropteridine diphosphokinase